MYHAPPPPPYRRQGTAYDLQSWLSSVSTLSSLDTMSSKGSSIVPTSDSRDSTNHRSRLTPPEDDDIDEQLGDDIEDDFEPSPSDRLLPFGPFYDDTDRLRNYRPVYRRAIRWIISRPRCMLASYREFIAEHSERTLVLIGLYVFLLISSIALAISTAVLAQHRGQELGRKQTRLPWSPYGRVSMSYELELFHLYPHISSHAEASCVTAWINTGLRPIRCHEKILNRAWDNGKQSSLFEPRYDLYAEAISSKECIEDLEAAYQILSSQCTSKDVFDTTGVRDFLIPSHSYLQRC